MFRNILDQIAEVWRGMNVPQRTAVVTVTLAVVATLVVVTVAPESSRTGESAS